MPRNCSSANNCIYCNGSGHVIVSYSSSGIHVKECGNCRGTGIVNVIAISEISNKSSEKKVKRRRHLLVRRRRGRYYEPLFTRMVEVRRNSYYG